MHCQAAGTKAGWPYAANDVDRVMGLSRWFDFVVVLSTDNTVLFQRLEGRGYPQQKIQENVQCEIMHVSIEEAREAYRCRRSRTFLWYLPGSISTLSLVCASAFR